MTEATPTSAARAYPEPPWHMHGEAVLCPYVVRADELALPPELAPVSVGGRCFGVLAYVRYEPPSPLCYDELIWMPALVAPRGKRGPRGYWVARMYVNDAATLAGGRELWALPKTLADFRRTDDRVEVQAEDGSELVLSYRSLGPKMPGKTRVATLQTDAGNVVRFRGDFRARIGLGTLSVVHFAPRHERWRGFPGASRFPRPATLLSAFRATMHPATRALSPLGVEE